MQNEEEINSHLYQEAIFIYSYCFKQELTIPKKLPSCIHHNSMRSIVNIIKDARVFFQLSDPEESKKLIQKTLRSLDHITYNGYLALISEGKVPENTNVRAIEILRKAQSSPLINKKVIPSNLMPILLMSMSIRYASRFLQLLRRITAIENHGQSTENSHKTISVDSNGELVSSSSAMVANLTEAMEAHSYGLAAYEKETGQTNINEAGKKAISEQAKKNKKGTMSKKKTALIEGLLEIVKKMKKVPTELQLKNWLSKQEDKTFLTGLIICPEIYIKIKGFDKQLGFSYRESNESTATLKDSKIAFGTYKNEYINLLKNKKIS